MLTCSTSQAVTKLVRTDKSAELYIASHIKFDEHIEQLLGHEHTDNLMIQALIPQAIPRAQDGTDRQMTMA